MKNLDGKFAKDFCMIVMVNSSFKRTNDSDMI